MSEVEGGIDSHIPDEAEESDDDQEACWRHRLRLLLLACNAVRAVLYVLCVLWWHGQRTHA